MFKRATVIADAVCLVLEFVVNQTSAKTYHYHLLHDYPGLPRSLPSTRTVPSSAALGAEIS